MESEITMGYPMGMSWRPVDDKAGAGHGNLDLGITCRDELG